MPAQFGLGWGYLLDTEAGHSVISTYYNGSTPLSTAGVFQSRTYGMGYSRKVVLESAGAGTAGSACTAGSPACLRVQQDVVAPFGDDPVLISLITVTNLGTSPRSIAWMENSGGAMRLIDHFSSTAQGMRMAQGTGFERARMFAELHYTSTFTPKPALSAMRQGRTWLPLNSSQQAQYEAIVAGMTAGEGAWSGPPMSDPPPGSSLWNEHPTATYVADLLPGAGGAVQWGTDCAAFYAGQGTTSGLQPPAAVPWPLLLPAAIAPVPNSVGCTLAAKAAPTPLAPGASLTFAYLWAYDVSGNESAGDGAVQGYVDKYSPLVADGTLLQSTVNAWLGVAASFSGPAVPAWATREVLWHSYALLGGATHDSTYGAHMIDQGMDYRYVGGELIAARDPAQHLLPAIASAPWLAKSVLLYLLQGVQQPAWVYNGSSVVGGLPMQVPYGLVGQHQIWFQELRPSDQEMYLSLALSEYILSTRDTGILREVIPLYRAQPGSPYAAVPIGEVLVTLLNYSMYNVSVGQHGLMRSLTSDWSDALCYNLQVNCTDSSSPVWMAFYEHGESVLNAAMATYVMPRAAQALALSGDPTYAPAIAAAQAFAASQAQALQGAGWNSNHTWLRRAFLSNETGWLGETQVMAIQHAWAILSGVLGGTDAAAVLSSVDAHLRAPSPIGASIMWPPVVSQHQAAGHGENGGVWPAMNYPYAWAVSTLNASMAWDEWRKNSLAVEALAYPDLWAGIWGSADSVVSFAATDGQAGKPGEWTRTWPVECAHRHAWPLFALEKMAGIAIGAPGMTVRPPLQPMLGGELTQVDEQWAGAWQYRTPVLSVARTGPTAWSGHWAPTAYACLTGECEEGTSAPRAAMGTLQVQLPVQQASSSLSCTLKASCNASGASLMQPAPVRALQSHEHARIGVGSGSLGDTTVLLAEVTVDVPEESVCGSLQWELSC